MTICPSSLLSTIDLSRTLLVLQGGNSMSIDMFALVRQLGATTTAAVFTIPAKQLARDDRRLEVAYYGSQGYQSLRAIEKSGFKLARIGEVGTVKQPPIFKRCFVDSVTFGVPYLNGIQL